MERSLIDQLVPARDVGLMVHGHKLFDDRLDYAGVDLRRGHQRRPGHGQEQGGGRPRRRPPVARLGLPDWAEGSSSGSPARSGTTAGYSPRRRCGPRRSSRGSSSCRRLRPDGTRTRWSPELVYYYGPFGLAAQYFAEDQELRAPAGGGSPSRVVDVAYRGGYVLATCLLTGEERDGVQPADHPAGPVRPGRRAVSGPGRGSWSAGCRGWSWMRTTRGGSPGSSTRPGRRRGRRR